MTSPTTRVLLVDDEDTVARVLTRILSIGGYEVRRTASALDALSVVAAEPAAFAVALIDVNLQDGDGRLVAERLRALAPELPAVLTTGDREIDPESVKPAALLHKPFSPAQLFAAIAAAIAR